MNHIKFTTAFFFSVFSASLESGSEEMQFSEDGVKKYLNRIMKSPTSKNFTRTLAVSKYIPNTPYSLTSIHRTRPPPSTTRRPPHHPPPDSPTSKRHSPTLPQPTTTLASLQPPDSTPHMRRPAHPPSPEPSPTIGDTSPPLLQSLPTSVAAAYISECLFSRSLSACIAVDCCPSGLGGGSIVGMIFLGPSGGGWRCCSSLHADCERNTW